MPETAGTRARPPDPDAGPAGAGEPVAWLTERAEPAGAPAAWRSNGDGAR